MARGESEILTEALSTDLVDATDASLAIGLSRAEIDMQVLTAKKFPRQITRITQNIISLATLDEETAEECMYALPRGGKPIQGPSIRFAEIVESCYGNCRSASRVVFVDRVEKVVIAEGVFHDLETNKARRSEVRRRIVDKKGRLYSDDMIIVTGNAAGSIAMRNAILAGVPRPIWRRAYDMVQRTIAGDVTTLSETRDKAVKALAHFGVTPEQVFQAIGVAGIDDIRIEHIPILRGMFSALKNGEATVEEMFNFRTTVERDPDFNPLVPSKERVVPETGEVLHTTARGDSSNANGPEAGVAAASMDPQPEDATSAANKAEARPTSLSAGDKEKSSSTGATKDQQPPWEADESSAESSKTNAESSFQDSAQSAPSGGAGADEAGGADKGEAATAVAVSPQTMKGYSQALYRALQPKTLEKTHKDFWDGKPTNFDEPSRQRLTAIYSAHLKRCKKEIDDRECDRAIKEALEK